jgi:alkylhydroperoxidase family enzyme
MSVRRAVARPAGVDDLDEAVRRYERSELDEPIKVALRLADAYLAHPAGFDDQARARTLEHYRPAQIVELLYKLMYFSGNKATIALGLDRAIDPSRLTAFHYDEAGHFVVDGHGVVGTLE